MATQSTKFLHKKKLIFWISFGLVFGIFFLGLTTGVYKLISARTKLYSETALSEMNQIPAEVKRQMRRQALASPSASLQIPILMYHYVENVKDRRDVIRQELNVSPNIFEEQLKTLINSGFTFMTARDIGAIFDGDMDLPKNPVLLTFDDGHWDLATDVLPILVKYKIRATAYIAPGLLGGTDYLTKDQLKKVSESGLVEIAAHTVNHVALKGKPEKVLRYEIGESKKMLEELLQIKVVSFAYPYGAFDEKVIATVKQAGFTSAVSTISGIDQSPANRYFLYRLRPGSRVGEALLISFREKKRR